MSGRNILGILWNSEGFWKKKEWGHCQLLDFLWSLSELLWRKNQVCVGAGGDVCCYSGGILSVTDPAALPKAILVPAGSGWFCSHPYSCAFLQLPSVCVLLFSLLSQLQGLALRCKIPHP